MNVEEKENRKDKVVKVVFDTNVMVSALLWTGLPHRLLKLADGEILQLCATLEMLEEIEEVLNYSKFASQIKRLNTSINELILHVEDVVTVYYPKEIVERAVDRDPDDNIFLTCAVCSGAKFIISGDDHLLEMREFRKTKILSPRRFIERIEASSQ